MNFQDLVDGVGGPSKVSMQFLDHCTTDLRSVKKGGTKITFLTDGTIPDLLPGGKRFGLILWFDRPAVTALVNAAAKKEAKKARKNSTSEDRNRSGRQPGRQRD